MPVQAMARLLQLCTLLACFVSLCNADLTVKHRMIQQVSPEGTLGATVLNPTIGEPEPHLPYVHPKQWQSRSLMTNIDPNINITISSYVMAASPSTYTVTWTGVTTPRATDLIGVWTPGENDPSTVAPYEWWSANSTNYLTTGSGSVNITIYNLRGNLRFRLVEGLPYQPFPNPAVLGESDLVMNLISNKPQQVHLGIYADEKSVVVQWVSNTSAPTLVSYGFQSGAPYFYAAMSTTAMYTRDMMCGSPANGSSFTHPGWTHTAVLPTQVIGSGKKVFYLVGDAQNGFSKEYSFTSPLSATPVVNPSQPAKSDRLGWLAAWLAGTDTTPEPSTPEPPFKFLIFNDVGSTSETLFNDTCICSNFTANQTLPQYGCMNLTDGSGGSSCCAGYCPIPQGNPEGQDWYLTMFKYTPNSIKLAPVLAAMETDANLAILNGDLSYAQGYTDSWDIFGNQFEDAFARWPLVTGVGNHERDYPGSGDIFNGYNATLDAAGGVRDSGGECNVPYSNRYYNPGPDGKVEPLKSYRSFTMGPVFFIIIDTETSSNSTSAQGMWANQTLSSVDRSITPWVVVSTHRMMLWPSTDTRPLQGDNAVSARLLVDFEDMFLGKVDFVVFGHNHAYGRTCSVYKKTCVEPAASTFINNPTAPIYILSGHAGAGFTRSFPSVLPDWVAFGAQFINGYVRFQATMNTITMESISADPLVYFNGVRNNTFPAGGVIDTVTLTRS